MITCPACHASCAGDPERWFTSGEAAQHFVLREEHPDRHARLQRHIVQLWGGERCALHRCAACGLGFAWPFVAGGAEFYNLAYPHSDYPSRRWEFDETVRSIREQPIADGRVLEIGSGFGWFLRQLSPELVPRERVLSIEYNDVARARLGELGFEAHGVDIRDATFDVHRGRLSAIFMFQVLEHMDSLDALVDRVTELARPGASLFVAVPNIDRIDFNEGHGSMLDMPPNHISRWTEASFRALASRAGWTMTDFRREPMRWSEFARRDLVYSHMRRAQKSGSLANRVRALQRSPWRVGAEAAMAVAALPGRLPAWAEVASQRRELGDSAWVRLRIGA